MATVEVRAVVMVVAVMVAVQGEVKQEEAASNILDRTCKPRIQHLDP